MEVRLYRRTDNKYLVVMKPGRRTGLPMVVQDAVDRKDVASLVLPVAQQEEVVRARIEAAKRGEEQP
jgi:hypothetical protein